MEIISIDQLDELKGAIKEAEKDDTPYIGIKDDELHVLGDPNKTEVKAADYMVCFAFPNTDEWRARAEMNGDRITKTSEDGRYFLCEREYKNIYLTPRRMANAVSALAQVESFLYKITDGGEVKDMTTAETLEAMNVMGGELADSTYDLVSTVLRIPYDEKDWMISPNVMLNTVKIVVNNPSAMNEADLFFGLPQGSR